ncbi:MAG: Binding-protein-dependent transport system inner rane component [Bacteroidetes bacterium]|nr:Binding-protein-dependent transport system inner rane component [Bacteroidota bacterium]
MPMRDLGSRQRIPWLLVRLTRLVTDSPDRLWAGLWILGIGALWAWDAAFLNRPAYLRLQAAFVNTMAGATLTVLFTLVLGWSAGLVLDSLSRRSSRIPYLLLTFTLSLIRSLPQIVGILIGYVLLTIFIERDIVRSTYLHLIWTALLISVFTFLELTDLLRERIDQYRKTDFFNAMLCCGIPERRIINVDVLWKNSLAHIFQKLIATFGMAIFLQCSIDFIISVGLSMDVSLSNFSPTLGSLLASLDSKQDILAIGVALGRPGYAGELLFRHLQGISVAFLIVFSLVCMYKISNGIVRRYRL